LLYFVANIEEKTAAGIAEFRITTDLMIPVRLNNFTETNPKSRPIPILRNEAKSVVGKEVIFTLDRL